MLDSDVAVDAAMLMMEQSRLSWEVWIYSILGSVLVGLSGIFPLLVIPLEAGPSLKHGAPAARLKLMLSFAVGSLLGDVFCHLLPEVWAYMDRDDHKSHIKVGLWVIGGMLFFMIIEKLFGDETEFEPMEDTCDEMYTESSQVTDDTLEESSHSHTEDTKCRSSKVTEIMPVTDSMQEEVIQLQSGDKTSHTSNIMKRDPVTGHKIDQHIQSQTMNRRSRVPSIPSHITNGNGNSDNSRQKIVERKQSNSISPNSHIKVSGYLNLFANVVDNFTHGLAVAGSFIISNKVGMLTTVAILLHEVPHEVGDFAILLRSGFDRWRAAKAQILTAMGGVFGAVTAMTAESAQTAGERTSWVLPFTSGGFLYIALVTVVPDLLQEKHALESLKQTCCLLLGICCMVCVTLVFD